MAEGVGLHRAIEVEQLDDRAGEGLPGPAVTHHSRDSRLDRLDEQEELGGADDTQEHTCGGLRTRLRMFLRSGGSNRGTSGDLIPRSPATMSPMQPFPCSLHWNPHRFG